MNNNKDDFDVWLQKKHCLTIEELNELSKQEQNILYIQWRRYINPELNNMFK